jgi:hypothetical protein
VGASGLPVGAVFAQAFPAGFPGFVLFAPAFMWLGHQHVSTVAGYGSSSIREKPQYMCHTRFCVLYGSTCNPR